MWTRWIIEGGKKVDDDKVERNKTKREETRLNDESMLDATITRQKELYGRRHTIFQAWVAQGRYVEGMDTRKPLKYARDNEKGTLGLDVHAIKPASDGGADVAGA